MKRIHVLFVSAFAVALMTVGCATTQELTTTVKSKVSSWTSAVDPALVNQVPAERREGFKKAEYDVKVAAEKLKLAELKTEQAGMQKKYFEYEEDMAASFRKEAEIDYDLVKIEAVIQSGLGKKDENSKVKADLKSKKMKAQADRIKIQADIENARAKIDELAGQIAKTEASLKAMTSPK
jgi:chromosome segregation ATPase